MEKPVRVGFVGARFAARFHWEGIRRVYGVPVEIVGVTSKTPEARDAFARDTGTRAFETFAANVTMGRLPDGGLECPGEMETAQARNRRQMIKRKIAFEVRRYVVKHAGQSAPIEPLPCGTEPSLRR